MNNSFEQSIADICGLELTSVLANGKYTVFGNKVAVVEGHKGIVEYSSDVVAFSLGNATLRICGSNLQLRCLEKHYAVVVGKVTSVARLCDGVANE